MVPTDLTLSQRSGPFCAGRCPQMPTPGLCAPWPEHLLISPINTISVAQLARTAIHAITTYRSVDPVNGSLTLRRSWIRAR